MSENIMTTEEIKAYMSDLQDDATTTACFKLVRHLVEKVAELEKKLADEEYERLTLATTVNSLRDYVDQVAWRKP